MPIDIKFIGNMVKLNYPDIALKETGNEIHLSNFPYHGFTVELNANQNNIFNIDIGSFKFFDLKIIGKYLRENFKDDKLGKPLLTDDRLYVYVCSDIKNLNDEDILRLLDEYAKLINNLIQKITSSL